MDVSRTRKGSPRGRFGFLVVVSLFLLVAAAQAQTPTLTINDLNVAEGPPGPSVASFTVALSAPSTFTITVDYATANGSATAGADYSARSGSLIIFAGGTTAMIEVPITGDLIAEQNETFSVVLSNLSPSQAATIKDGTGIATILNDDGPTPTNTSTLTRTPTLTPTQTRTVTPPTSPSRTPTPSETPSPTPTLTATTTSTRTLTPTVTATALTATPTQTPFAGTPTPTPTPGPPGSPCSPATQNGWFVFVGRVAGASGSLFRTDLWLYNPDPLAPVTTVLTFHEQVGSGGPPGRTVSSAPIVLAPSETRFFPDVTLSTVPVGDGVVGALEWQSTGALLGGARVYTVAPEGTFGFFLPAVPVTQSLPPRSSPSDTAHQLHLYATNSGDANFRVQADVTNTSPVTLPVEVEVLDPQTQTVYGGTLTFSIAPKSLLRLGRILDQVGAPRKDGLRITVAIREGTLVPSGGLLAVATTLDNRTNDGFALPGQTAPEGSSLIGLAAPAGGGLAIAASKAQEPFPPHIGHWVLLALALGAAGGVLLARSRRSSFLRGLP